MIPGLFIVVYGVIFGLSAYAFAQTARFVRQYPTIDNARTLEAFKVLARSNMKLTLVLMPLYGVGILLTIVITLRHGLPGFLGALAVNGILGVFGMYGMSLEKKARSLPAATEELRREHQRVSESWVKKALPDF